ncbi:MAG: DUF1178 family protein [Rhodospirillales bacterium]|nr:DUF1178 family protein [Alphaproteobacteria bacterium]MBL6948825.1 DUF1178 family protein [Rhodospirillales bacterium]
MILYQLKCQRGHNFEAWFLNSATYDSQQSSDDVSCPHCGTTEVAKAPMAPNIARRRSEAGSDMGHDRGHDRAAGRGSEDRAQEVAEKILEAVDGLRQDVEDNCDYVGDEFAEEARRIHYGETEEHGIYGEASDEEAKELDEEGVDFFRLPYPRRRND